MTGLVSISRARRHRSDLRGATIGVPALLDEILRILKVRARTRLRRVKMTMKMRMMKRIRGFWERVLGDGLQ